MRRIAAAAVIAMALAAGMAFPSHAATEIGVTSAVLPNARGTPPEQDTRILQVGTGMFANERVQTVDNGKVHLLFQDGSALSVGPNSDIVLDKFVYDPGTKTGELSFSATKGIFRFVGGKISKTTPVTIKTPNATIGIRGGVGVFSIRELTRAALIFGDQLFVDTGTQRQTVTRNGFQIQILPNGTLTPPIAFNSESLDGDLDQLEANEGQEGTDTQSVSANDVALSQLSSLGSDLSPQFTGSGDPSNAGSAVDQIGAGSDAQDVTKEAPQDQPGGPGGGSSSGVSQIASGLVGRYRDTSNRANGVAISEIFDDPINQGVLSSGLFSGVTTDNIPGPIMWPVSTTLANDGNPGSGSFMDLTSSANTDGPYGPFGPPGVSFIADSQDFTYVFGRLVNLSSDDYIFAFAGIPTPTAMIPTSGFSVYSLKRDFHLQGDIPFIPAADGGKFGSTDFQDTGRAFINWTPNSAGERAVAELTTLYSGTGTAQKSATSVIVGKVIDDGTGKLHMVGSLRGSLRSSTTASTRTVFYRGPVSTVDAFDGSDFFGTSGPNFFTFGNQNASSTDVNNTATSGFDRVQAASSSTIYSGDVVATRLAGNGPAEDGTRISGSATLKLETAGISMQFFSNSTNAFERFAALENDALTTNFVTVNGADGTVTVNVNYIGIDQNNASSLSSASLGFGGNSSNSAFVSNDEFGAIENGATINSASASNFGYFRSLDLRFENLLVNSGLTPCGCDFLVAGLWGGQYSQSGNFYEYHQVPWVAGTPVTAADFPTSGVALYTGNAVANVHNNGAIYTAFGTFSAAVVFAPGTVNLSDVDIVVDGATMNNLTGSANTASQLYVPFNGMSSSDFGTLTTNGNARFAGSSGTLENIYGHYVTQNAAQTYRQGGVFGAER